MGSEWGEREVLALVCRVHELELERLEAHGTALAREHELRRRHSALRRHERQRQLCDQIITRQRQLIEGEWGREFRIYLKINRIFYVISYTRFLYFVSNRGHIRMYRVFMVLFIIDSWWHYN